MRLLLAVAVALLLTTPALAQSTGQVQGVANVGSATPSRPLAIGAQDVNGGSNQYATVIGGALQIAPVSTATFAIAAVTTTTGSPTPQNVVLDSNRALLVQNGINPFVDHPTGSGELNSSGVSEVTISAATSGQRNYLCTLTAENTSTTTIHTFKLMDHTSGKILWRATLSPGSATSAGGQATIDMNQGALQSGVGSSLTFKLGDAGGTDVVVTATTVTK